MCVLKENDIKSCVFLLHPSPQAGNVAFYRDISMALTLAMAGTLAMDGTADA